MHSQWACKVYRNAVDIACDIFWLYRKVNLIACAKSKASPKYGGIYWQSQSLVYPKVASAGSKTVLHQLWSTLTWRTERFDILFPLDTYDRLIFAAYLSERVWWVECMHWVVCENMTSSVPYSLERIIICTKDVFKPQYHLKSLKELLPQRK